MNFSFYYFGLILLFFVGFSFCFDPKDISSYDPEEFDLNELLNDPLVIEALQSNGSNVDEEFSSREPLEKKVTPKLKRKRSSTYITQKLISVGFFKRGNIEIPKLFQRLQPARVNPDNLTLRELEMRFYRQGNAHRWRELEEYHMSEYLSYWAYVCDYFWETEVPDEPHKRACYIQNLLFSENAYASIIYFANPLPSTEAEILRCSCHYYKEKQYKPVFPPAVFAVHKYSANEYFILTRASKDELKSYKISNFWTEVVLPVPIK